MQVGEQHLVLAQPVVLLGDRLLDLEHQVGVAPTRRRRSATIFAPGGDEVRRRGSTEPSPGAGLDDDVVPGADQLVRRPAGVIATRYSWFLTSRGTPTRMALAPSPEMRVAAPHG